MLGLYRFQRGAQQVHFLVFVVLDLTPTLIAGQLGENAALARHRCLVPESLAYQCGMGIDGIDQISDTVTRDGNSTNDRHHPVALWSQSKHIRQTLYQLIRLWKLGLVDHQNVRQFENSCFHCLNFIPKTWRTDDDPGICQLANIKLGLPGAERFDNHRIHAGCIENINDAACGQRQPPLMATRGDGSNENSIGSGVLQHANPVPEQSATGNGTGWINGYNTNCSPFPA